ncbi:hypothetical protein [Tateyamaria pelophila]|uniref:hypothetical protein n=1 Tax=Tateyamaria pelophila TaxID=328415 RepID=UPI001CBEC749|nr:hypothetical protein [Tateyamaria pelophila]
MDLVTGVAAASQAIKLVKEIGDIDRSIDEASFKLKIAEVVSALADTKMALADAKQRIHSLESDIKTLKKGDTCPMCKKGHLRVVSAEDSTRAGVEYHNCKCSHCEYKNKRLFDASMGTYASQLK